MAALDPNSRDGLCIIEATDTCAASLSTETPNRVIIYRSDSQRLLRKYDILRSSDIVQQVLEHYEQNQGAVGMIILLTDVDREIGSRDDDKEDSFIYSMPQQAAHIAHRDKFPAWAWVLHNADDQEVEGFMEGLRAAAKLDGYDIHFEKASDSKIEEIDPQKRPYKQCPNPDAWSTAPVYWTQLANTVQTVAAKVQQLTSDAQDNGDQV
ncbi:MAG: hypothetical protein Q9160_008632 [Pyrenula sp. 1 TL-2023]